LSVELLVLIVSFAIAQNLSKLLLVGKENWAFAIASFQSL